MTGGGQGVCSCGLQVKAACESLPLTLCEGCSVNRGRLATPCGSEENRGCLRSTGTEHGQTAEWTFQIRQGIGHAPPHMGRPNFQQKKKGGRKRREMRKRRKMRKRREMRKRAGLP